MSDKTETLIKNAKKQTKKQRASVARLIRCKALIDCFYEVMEAKTSFTSEDVRYAGAVKRLNGRFMSANLPVLFVILRANNVVKKTKAFKLSGRDYHPLPLWEKVAAEPVAVSSVKQDARDISAQSKS